MQWACFYWVSNWSTTLHSDWWEGPDSVHFPTQTTWLRDCISVQSSNQDVHRRPLRDHPDLDTLQSANQFVAAPSASRHLAGRPSPMWSPTVPRKMCPQIAMKYAFRNRQTQTDSYRLYTRRSRAEWVALTVAQWVDQKLS